MRLGGDSLTLLTGVFRSPALFTQLDGVHSVSGLVAGPEGPAYS